MTRIPWLAHEWREQLYEVAYHGVVSLRYVPRCKHCGLEWPADGEADRRCVVRAIPQELSIEIQVDDTEAE